MAPSACVLCLVCTGHRHIGVFSEEGKKLHICETINKHFWLELSGSESSTETVCKECWQSVSSFNEFYQRVYNVHEHRRRGEAKSVPIEFFGETLNPLAQANDIDALAEGFFATNEVKVEVNELDLLPKVEVFEDPVDTGTLAGSKRGSIAQDGAMGAKKRIKSERTPVDSDSDGDVPLAEFLSTDIRTESNDSAPPADIKHIKQRKKKVLEVPRRSLRTRTVKTTKEPTPPTELKKEYESDDDDDDNDAEFVAAEAVLGTDDSASSSSSSGGETDDSLPDAEPEERYAEIPKRVVVKPKKYRKRPKPLVPPVRMSREEIERRKNQQNEYDDIILKFFKKIPCHVCNLLVQNFGDMRKHLRMSHNLEGYMLCCGRKFYIRKALAEHVMVHGNPEQFKCTKCGRIFQDSRTLEIHEQTHTNPQTETKEKRVFQCEKCPKTFSTKAAIEYHIVSKHVPKSDFKFTCPECNKKVPTERKLKEHLKYMHDPETAIICDKCGKTVRSQANLKKHHELEHSDGPRPKPDPVQCEICGTWLRHINGLKQHMKTIHEPPGGEHRCPICNKTSTNSRALKRHIYHNHECERKFKCTMCEKAFKRPQDLREHTSTHTGEVLYTCPNCPMTFFSNANMYKHRQRLHRAEWEADRKKPLPPNIMQQAVGATTALKKRQASDVNATALFGQPPQHL
ncbi:transcription factor grauzone [Scaptodrosophila lebanonensis]|uniref:Transcription factor grauzone n=1 Tax=Drosophila lebanonensis TaxID=7225 RepID=A0A6J2TBD5_DROLE|nr:transcription factor grauzone [Scaptodrosophila lebanonensis]